MALSGTAVVTALAVIVYLQLVLPASAQVIVDLQQCRTFGHHCGQPDSPSSEKYCCAEGSNGGGALYNCCNPYTGLFIGLGVSVPTIVFLIVLCIVSYVVYARYRRKKLQTLLRSYAERASVRERRTSSSFMAPPPYTPFARDGETHLNESELPAYTEEDQFATATTALDSAQDPTSEQPSSEAAAEQSSEDARNEAVTETSEIPLEDVPLLSDDESQS